MFLLISYSRFEWLCLIFGMWMSIVNVLYLEDCWSNIAANYLLYAPNLYLFHLVVECT
jgi:hypothetical protein